MNIISWLIASVLGLGLISATTQLYIIVDSQYKKQKLDFQRQDNIRTLLHVLIQNSKKSQRLKGCDAADLDCIALLPIKIITRRALFSDVLILYEVNYAGKTRDFAYYIGNTERGEFGLYRTDMDVRGNSQELIPNWKNFKLTYGLLSSDKKKYIFMLAKKVGENVAWLDVRSFMVDVGNNVFLEVGFS